MENIEDAIYNLKRGMNPVGMFSNEEANEIRLALENEVARKEDELAKMKKIIVEEKKKLKSLK